MGIAPTRTHPGHNYQGLLSRVRSQVAFLATSLNVLVVMFRHPMPGHLVVVGGLTVRGAKNPVTYMTYMDIAFAGRIPLAHASGLVCVGTLGGFRESLPCAVGRLARVLAISQPLVYIRAAFSTQLAC